MIYVCRAFFSRYFEEIHSLETLWSYVPSVSRFRVQIGKNNDDSILRFNIDVAEHLSLTKPSAVKIEYIGNKRWFKLTFLREYVVPAESQDVNGEVIDNSYDKKGEGANQVNNDQFDPFVVDNIEQEFIAVDSDENVEDVEVVDHHKF